MTITMIAGAPSGLDAPNHNLGFRADVLLVNDIHDTTGTHVAALESFAVELRAAGLTVAWVTFSSLHAPTFDQPWPEGVLWIRENSAKSLPGQAYALASLIRYLCPGLIVVDNLATLPAAMYACLMTHTSLASLFQAPISLGTHLRIARWLGCIVLPRIFGLDGDKTISIEQVRAEVSSRRASKHRLPEAGGWRQHAVNLLFGLIRHHQYQSARRQIAAVVSEIFDRDWYASAYLKHANAIDPLEHYLNLGQFIGLDPNPWFWSTWYLRQYPDVAAESINPWMHYFLFGAAEKRDPCPFFQTGWYAAKALPDSKANPLLDYLRNPGPTAPHPLIDVSWYLAEHGDAGIPNMKAMAALVAGRGTHEAMPLLRSHPELLADPAGFPIRYEVLAQRFDYSAHFRGRVRSASPRRYALCTVITGLYDKIPLPVWNDPDVDYILITDQSNCTASGWDRLIHLPATQDTAVVRSRYAKMHLAALLGNSETYAAIAYLDGNIVTQSSVAPLLDAFVQSQGSLGLVPHPERNCVYQEAAAIVTSARDNVANVAAAIAFLESESHPPAAGLYEMNFFAFVPSADADRFFAEWWSLFNRYGNRDQLLVPYLLRMLGIKPWILMQPPLSVRTHPSFAVHAHRLPPIA